MRGSCLRRLIWIGPVSESVGLGVVGAVAGFRAFITNLNNFGR